MAIKKSTAKKKVTTARRWSKISRNRAMAWR